MCRVYLRTVTNTVRLQRWYCLIHSVSKNALFSVFSLNQEKLIKKQTYMKTENCKLYSGVF